MTNPSDPQMRELMTNETSAKALRQTIIDYLVGGLPFHEGLQIENILADALTSEYRRGLEDAQRKLFVKASSTMVTNQISNLA